MNIFSEIKSEKERDGVCKICNKAFTYEVKRGRAPSMCSSATCLQTHRRLMRKSKPRVIRKHVCEDCDTEIVQKGKGRTIKRCEECRIKLKQKQNADYRAKTFRAIVREQGTCIDCSKDLGTKKGRGNLVTRCPTCQLKQRNEIARVSALKNYIPIIRYYTCEKCKQEKEQKGRGKLRKTCVNCAGKKLEVVEVVVSPPPHGAKSEGDATTSEVEASPSSEPIEEGEAMWSDMLDSMDD